MKNLPDGPALHQTLQMTRPSDGTAATRERLVDDLCSFYLFYIKMKIF